MGKVYIFVIGKLENRYFREWTEHYKSLGVDRVILGDNNDKDGERFEEVIGDYIESGFVTVKDYRGLTTDIVGANMQSLFYENCFREYHGECEWIGIFDCDELLELPCGIHEFLSRSEYDGYEQIKFYWRNFNDGGMLRPDGDYRLKERFHTWFKSNTIKSVFRANAVTDPKLISGHCCNGLKSCNAHGEYLSEDACSHIELDKSEKYDIAWVDHYPCKTIEEFISFKMKRGYPDRSDSFNKGFFKVERFFAMNNERTREKVKLALDMGCEVKLKTYEQDLLKI